MLAVASNAEKYFLNSFKRDLGKYTCTAFSSSELLNIHIFKWYKALYSAFSSTFRHLNFIKAIHASPISKCACARENETWRNLKVVDLVCKQTRVARFYCSDIRSTSRLYVKPMWYIFNPYGWKQRCKFRYYVLRTFVNVDS